MTGHALPPRAASVPFTLPGVRSGTLVRHADERGAFRELWRESAFASIPPADAGLPPDAVPRFTQANLSTSSAGVLRGLHYHRRQADFWVALAGVAVTALVDIRPAQDGSGPARVELRTLRPDDWLLIPAGVAHGFLAIEPLDLLYLVTNEYDGSDELGFAWDDPAVAVPWPAVPGTPDGRPILSERDRTNPTLAALLAQLRA